MHGGEGGQLAIQDCCSLEETVGEELLTLPVRRIKLLKLQVCCRIHWIQWERCRHRPFIGTSCSRKGHLEAVQLLC